MVQHIHQVTTFPDPALYSQTFQVILLLAYSSTLKLRMFPLSLLHQHQLLQCSLLHQEAWWILDPAAGGHCHPGVVSLPRVSRLDP